MKLFSGLGLVFGLVTGLPEEMGQGPGEIDRMLAGAAAYFEQGLSTLDIAFQYVADRFTILHAGFGTGLISHRRIHPGLSDPVRAVY